MSDRGRPNPAFMDIMCNNWTLDEMAHMDHKVLHPSYEVHTRVEGLPEGSIEYTGIFLPPPADPPLEEEDDW